MLFLVPHLSDGKAHSDQETVKNLTEHFQTGNEELAQRLPSAQVACDSRGPYGSRPFASLKPVSSVLMRS
jgi:hypothetical protein